jgi:hypothetical protein
MASLRTLLLSLDQRRELEAHRDHDSRPYVRERCAALLKIAAGKAAYWVAQHGLLKRRQPDTVYGWLTRYQQEGLAGLVAHPQGGNHRRRLRPYTAGCDRPAAASATRRGGPPGGGSNGQ